MRRFSDSIVTYRVPIVVLIIAVTAVMAYSLKDMQVNSDILSYLPEGDPLVELFNEVGDKFGGNSLAMVALETNDVFNHDTLSRVRQLTKAYERVEGVTDVISLTNILDIKKIEGGLEVGKLIDEHRIPESQEELHALKEHTLSKDMYVGSLVSRDGTLTTIICRIEEDADNLEVAKELKRLTEKISGCEKVYYAGTPFQMIDISRFILGDMSKLTPIVALLVMVILYFSFRSFRGVFLPLGTVVISIVWVLGIMGRAGYPITLISGIMPVLLIAVGSAYGIHMLSKYYEDARKLNEEGDNAQAAEKLWGAITALVKVYSCKKGVFVAHWGRGKLHKFVEENVEEAFREKFSDLLTFGGELHEHFFERHLPRRKFDRRWNQCIRLIDELKERVN